MIAWSMTNPLYRGHCLQTYKKSNLALLSLPSINPKYSHAIFFFFSLPAQVVPREYGPSWSPIDLLTAPYKRCTRGLSEVYSSYINTAPTPRRWTPLQHESDGAVSRDEEECVLRGVGVEGDPADFEPLSASSLGKGGAGTRGEGVIISGLRKEFGEKVAVAGLDLRLLPGDITCILGHNGAGGRVCGCCYGLQGCSLDALILWIS